MWTVRSLRPCLAAAASCPSTRLCVPHLCSSSSSSPPPKNRLQTRIRSSSSFDREKGSEESSWFPSEAHRGFRKERSSSLDDSENTVLLFPGQGSESVGMCSDLSPSAQALFDRASHLLGYDLLQICLEGPPATLHATLHSQPAVVVASLAAVEKLYQEVPQAVERCVAAAGFSVGEITALIFSGALTFDDGIRLVKIRAESMQHSSELVPSGMMSVFFGANHKVGLATEAAKEWAKVKYGREAPVCQVANFLYSGAKVIAGHKECLQFIETNASDFNIRRCRHLPVSGAFHTPLMQPALSVFKTALAHTEVHDPRIPVHSCHEQRVLLTARQVRNTLPLQMVRTVRWEQAMVKLLNYDDPVCLPMVYECGPGKGGLSAILKKVKGTAGKKAKLVPV